MGKLYDTVRTVEAVIARRGLPMFKTKARIALEVGFSLSLVNAQTPDDPARIEALRSAARKVLGEPLP